jgi:hypothetical protein
MTDYPTPLFQTLSLVGDTPLPVEGIVSNATTRFRESFVALDPEAWNVLSTGAGDLVEIDGNAGGASYLKISKHALSADTETAILARATFDMPMRVAVAVSLSQRTAGADCTVELVGLDSSGARSIDAASAEQTLTTISQTTTTLSATSSAPHGLVPGDRVDTYGCADSRLNYASLLVATIPTATTWTATATTYAALPSVTSAPAGGAKFLRTGYGAGDRNVVGVLMDGTSASNAIYFNRGKGESEQKSAAVGLTTSFSTATVPSSPVAFNTAFAYAFMPAASIDMVMGFDALTLQTIPSDTVSTAPSSAFKRTVNLPDEKLSYSVLIRARNRRSRTVPVARIVTVAKTGTTTATVTTDAAHGLSVTDYVRLYGVYDQTNFANVAADTVVASVIDATTFTVVWGSAVTATAHGGTVFRSNGGQAPSPLGQVVQSISQAGGMLTVTGNVAWTGIAIGETVYLHGLYDTAGNSFAQLEGVWKVGNAATTVLTLVATSLISPVADFTIVNMSGTVIKQTDFRLHYVRAMDYTRLVAEIYGGLQRGDVSAAVPVSMVNTSAISASTNVQSTQANNSATAPNPVLTSAMGVNANPAAGTTGQHQRAIGTLIGVPITKPYSIPEGDWSTPAAGVTSTTADVILKAAGAAGIKNYLTAIQVANTNATATEIVIKDGSSVIWRCYAPANFSMTNIIFPSPLKTTAATALNFACVTAGASVYVSAQGYSAP